MVSPEDSNWLYDIPNFSASASASESESAFNAYTNLSVDIDGSIGESDCLKESGSTKKGEIKERERLNDKFEELGALLDPGWPPRTDKGAILADAVRMVTHLRIKAQKLKDSNLNLQEKIKELKAEKNELRDEKQRLKAEKEKLEQQLKTMNAQTGFLPPAIPATAVDTLQDHVFRPPVAYVCS